MNILARVANYLLGNEFKPYVKRSPHWPAVRKAWLEKHPECAVCGTKDNVEVHHKVPVHIDPSKELDESNFITLCEEPGRNHHFLFGHLLNWHSLNKDVDKDTVEWKNKIDHRP